MGESSLMYACLYTPSFAAQAVLRLRPELRRNPVAILDGESPREFVLSVNAAARQAGAAVGMSRLQAESLPNVQLLPRSHIQEGAARTALLESASSFSPRVELVEAGYACEPDSTVVLDIRGTEGLFGSPELLTTKLRSRTSGQGMITQAAASANFHAAVCAARGFARVKFIPPGEERNALASLPLRVLDLSPEMAETFSLWGIRDCGMLAALPEHELVARIGVEGQRLLALARGEHRHLFVPIEQSFASQLIEVFELDHPVELLEPLFFLLSRMLEQLLLRIQSRSLAIASIEIGLKLESDTKRQARCHSRTIRPALPSRDLRRLLKLVQLDLEAHRPEAAVVALEMRVEPASPHIVQHGLFLPQGPDPDQLEVLLARLKKLLGEDRVGAAQLIDTQQADSFRMGDFAPRAPQDRASPDTAGNVPMAFRVCRPPLPIGVSTRGNVPLAISVEGSSFAVVMRAGPWRRSGEWWSLANWCREEWDVVLSDNVSEKICRIAHDPKSQCWYLAGDYD
jgi:protein ImuB